MSDRIFEIMSLMIGMFSGITDEYGHDLVPPLPLSLDVALENRPPASEADLLKMPADFLTRMISILPHDALAAFSHVNSDCLQLVRSLRYANVRFDFSRRSLSILALLFDEAKQRNRNNGLAKRPALGACIRRLTIATCPGSFKIVNRLTESDRESLNDEQLEERMKKACELYFDYHLKAIEHIFNSNTVPHLQILDFEDKVTLPGSFYSALMGSSIQHLKLFRIRTPPETLELQLPKTIDEAGWPLQTLHLEISGLSDETTASANALTRTILELCSCHLRSLVLVPACHGISDLALDSMAIQFLGLQRLDLGFYDFSDDSVLRALIGPNSQLRSLVANIGGNAISSVFFGQYGTLRTLETLVWKSTRVSEAYSLGFLENNPQLKKFSIPDETDRTFLNDLVLPILSDSFHSLRSLRLSFQGKIMSQSALANISAIGSLEQLCLSVGMQFGWRHEWRIDHKSLRRHLGKLPHLRKLALERDSYSVVSPEWDDDHHHDEAAEGSVESYYSSQHHPQTPEEAHFQRTVLRRIIWRQFDIEDNDVGGQEDNTPPNRTYERISELIHRRRMLIEAGKYAKHLKKLEWIYIGQLPMVITESPWSGGHGIRRRAMALTDERDDCYTLLNAMFGADEGKFEVVK